MADPTRIRPHPIALGAVALAGAAALAWWRAAVREPALQERTRGRLKAGVPRPLRPPTPPPPPPGPTGHTLANHHYSPDLSGLRVGR